MKVKALLGALCLSLLMTGAAFAQDDAFDFNTATADEMVTICKAQGVTLDPAIAAAIVAYREANGPFATEDDLAKVEGVTPQLIMQLYPQESAGSLWFDPSSIPGMHGY